MIDDEDRENEGDLIFAAELATPELVAFMVRYTSGYICVPLTEADADRLDLPPMFHTNQDRRGTAYTVTVDAREGVSTGISAADRAHTIRLLADPRPPPPTSPGRGTWSRCARRTAGCCAVPGTPRPRSTSRVLAGLHPAGVLCEVVSEKDPAGMARADELRVFADEHDLALISIADLIAYRRRFEKLVERVASARVPLRYGEFTAVGYSSSSYDQREHVAFVFGDIGDGEDVLVRVHSECLTGDVFGSLRCDCGPQLDAALAAVAREGRGVVLYVRGHEGRGIGLLHKLQAYQLQDAGVGHPRREPRAGAARRRARLRHRRADPRRPRDPFDAAAVEQPGQARRPRGLRAARSSGGCRCRCTPTRRTCATCRPSATGWATISTSIIGE